MSGAGATLAVRYIVRLQSMESSRLRMYVSLAAQQSWRKP
jgi:hypothetical protein